MHLLYFGPSVATGFNTVEQALTNTLVKTVAISGAIVVYTLVALVLFPLTATQQVCMVNMPDGATLPSQS